MADPAKVRLVRCPKCDNLLPELADYSVYQCGGCGTVLRAKSNTSGSDSLSERSDDGRIVGGYSAKSEDSFEKGNGALSDALFGDVKSKSGFSSRCDQMDQVKEGNGMGYNSQSKVADDVGSLQNGHYSRMDRYNLGKAVQREHDEAYTQNSSKTDSKSFDLGERGGVNGFHRNLREHVDAQRFRNSNYPDEGPSNGFSNSDGEPWRNHKDLGEADRVQYLEQDRAELLRKLDELKEQLSRSCDVGSNSKEKIPPDGRMIPPDPYGGPGTRYPDGYMGLKQTSMQFFGPDKHGAGPSYFNHPHDPYVYPNLPEMNMHSFCPPMHNLNSIPRYGDRFGSQMISSASNPLSHQFQQQPSHPYFSGQYKHANPDMFDPYTHNAFPHQGSCSCFHCYESKRRAALPVPPPAFGNNRFNDAPNNSVLYHHEDSAAFGHPGHNSRITIPTRPHSRWPSDINSEIDGFVRIRPRKVMLAGSGRRCRPVARGAPLLTCYNCFEVLQLPKKPLMKGQNQSVQCGACSTVISFVVVNNKLIFSHHSEMKGLPLKVDDTANEFSEDHIVHSHGRAKWSGANFSSDDYDNSGYDFQSMDREPVSLARVTCSDSSKPQEMQSFHSPSSSSYGDENSLEVVVSSQEVNITAPRPIGATLSPPPAGSPLQEHFDYSSNNYATNRFGKGNRSSRSEQERVINKVTSRQNSLKETAVATEMEVSFNDYSNTAVSQDSGDASKEHEHPKANKGGESFFANIIKKSFRDFSRSNHTDERGKDIIRVNGHVIPDNVIKKAEKLAGPIQPGQYWYDSRAGFWGVMGGPCLGIIPPYIEEFNFPMPENCAAGNSGVFVNGRELHQKDLDLLAGRGLPTDRDRSYVIEISGRVLDQDTGKELESLGKLAPTVEKAKHGFGMKVPRAAAKPVS